MTQNQNQGQNQNSGEDKSLNAANIKLSEREDAKEKFTGLLKKIHKMDCETAASIYEREAMYYRQALKGEEKLQRCTHISCYAAFLEIAVLGVSIQPGAKSEAYLEPRGGVCYLRISAYGELNLRIRSGQIIRMSNPQVIYEGDHFQPHTNERGDLTVDYRPLIPRKSSKITGCYVCIVLPGDGRDFKWLLEDDIARLKGYSERGFGGKANALYGGNGGQIDVGFLEAKTIKHAMRAYTKLRVGDNVVMDDDSDEAGSTAGSVSAAATDAAASASAKNETPSEGEISPEEETDYEDLNDIPF
ncbi:MAG: recombinase RecT [Prevotellaceae bacterium]|jgi:recombinational DNA repair protein RecT|nr:recombinase RecT [Prevotellaceae bacterium]